MSRETDIRIDAASALSKGARSRQEDALAMSFSIGEEIGFAVLSDGMGGHAAGDLASRIIVTEIFAELTMRLAGVEETPDAIPGLLRDAIEIANSCIRAQIADRPETHGMGGTVVVAVVVREQLYWISVGDSPLYLFREGRLSRLNDDHSLAPQIDLMVRQGLLDAVAGRDHPQRNCLTSVLMGEAMGDIDCTDDPFMLRPDDLVIVASDGLQFLPDDRLEAVIAQSGAARSAEVASDLMAAVYELEDPEQDNVALVVLKADRVGQVQQVEDSETSTERLRAVSGAFAPMRQLMMRMT